MSQNWLTGTNYIMFALITGELDKSNNLKLETKDQKPIHQIICM